MQGNKLNLSTSKRKGDTSHGTRRKHQLQLFKNFWNDTFENSIPSINLNISTILICFRFTSCLFAWGFCCCGGYVRGAENLLKYWYMLHVWPSSHLPLCNNWQSTWRQADKFLTEGILCPVSLLSPITSMSLLTSPHSGLQKKSYFIKSKWPSKKKKKEWNFYYVVVALDV